MHTTTTSFPEIDTGLLILNVIKCFNPIGIVIALFDSETEPKSHTEYYCMGVRYFIAQKAMNAATIFVQLLYVSFLMTR